MVSHWVAQAEQSQSVAVADLCHLARPHPFPYGEYIDMVPWEKTSSGDRSKAVLWWSLQEAEGTLGRDGGGESNNILTNSWVEVRESSKGWWGQWFTLGLQRRQEWPFHGLLGKKSEWLMRCKIAVVLREGHMTLTRARSQQFYQITVQKRGGED